MGRGSASQQGQDNPRGAQARRLAGVRTRVAAHAARVAELGEWPDYIPPESMLERLPGEGKEASGFDAGIACTLDLIPRERQKLAAQLHAAYTETAVEQVRAETAGDIDPDSDSAWWLAACSVCREEGVDTATFEAQVDTFRELAGDPGRRGEVAAAELQAMKNRYELRDGVPFATADGGMQGAYLDGHDLAAMEAPEHGLYFVGTFRESLGLESFAWSDATDDQGRPRSGPVHGSRQFVKCADETELAAALAVCNVSS